VIYCRQAPQVGVNFVSIVHTATILYSQLAIILSMAHLSAQVPSPDILHSTLHPPKILPSSVNTLAQIL